MTKTCLVTLHPGDGSSSLSGPCVEVHVRGFYIHVPEIRWVIFLHLSIYRFSQDNTVSPTCQSIVLLPLLPLTLIVHWGEKSSVLCPYSSAQTLILERDMFSTVESAARGAKNGWLQLAGAEHWTRILYVRVHADLWSGKRRKPNYHPVGCSGRMPPTACSGVGRCHVAWITSTAKWV